MNGARHDATFEGVSGDQVRLLKLTSRVEIGIDGSVYEAVMVDGPSYGTIEGVTDFDYTETDVAAPYVWLPLSIGSGPLGVAGETALALIVFAAMINAQWFAIAKLKAVVVP